MFLYELYFRLVNKIVALSQLINIIKWDVFGAWVDKLTQEMKQKNQKNNVTN